jgi:hypothetical protein
MFKRGFSADHGTFQPKPLPPFFYFIFLTFQVCTTGIGILWQKKTPLQPWRTHYAVITRHRIHHTMHLASCGCFHSTRSQSVRLADPLVDVGQLDEKNKKRIEPKTRKQEGSSYMFRTVPWKVEDLVLATTDIHSILSSSALLGGIRTLLLCDSRLSKKSLACARQNKMTAAYALL